LAISHFLRRKDPSERKHIIHISSIAAQVGVLGVPLYIAAKHAISGFVRSLALLDESLGIRVTAVAPGVVKTPLWTEHPEKLKIVNPNTDQWVTADEVAEVMLAIIQQDKVSEDIGNQDEATQTIGIHGGSVLEVSKKVRPVTEINDPGPSGRPGNTVSNMHVLDQEVYDLLKEKDWGKGTASRAG
jgi:3-hydroxybutyrate dehydrogenase